MPAMQETQVRSLGGEDPLEKGMATHFSIFAWIIPWTEVKISTLTEVWKQLIPNVMDVFEGFKTPVEEVTAGVVEIVTKLESEVEPEDVN